METIPPAPSAEDNAYWDAYYQSNGAPAITSNFAQSILSSVDKSKTLLELGCGNGRDAFFFARNGIQTVAVDLSAKAIELNSSFGHDNVAFQLGDFTALENDRFHNIGNIYSRFTLHSVDHESYERTLDWCVNNLQAGGMLFLEARTVNDPLCGQGTDVGQGGWVTTHYRRFAKTMDVMRDLEERGFKLIHVSENFTDSWYKSDHAACYRITATKV